MLHLLGIGSQACHFKNYTGDLMVYLCLRAPAHSSKPLKSLKIICIMNKMYRPLSRQACY